MEIMLETKTVPRYREAFHQIKRIQDSAETVVPDINDDIGKIASVRSSLLLKSKEIIKNGVSVCGEVDVSILYITETEDKVSHLKLNKSFSIDYEIPEIDNDANAQIKLQISNIEARVINPRKISVTFEVCGELSCYVPEEIEEQSYVPEANKDLIKSNSESFEVLLPSYICEKTFAINEQYTFPSGKPVPDQLASNNVILDICDCQHVGSKLIIKGNVIVSATYLSKDAAYPVCSQFSSPFSQIIDIGTESFENFLSAAELTSSYFDLVDTISGETALNMELHAVIQLVCRTKQHISYISDVYSNQMPVNINHKTLSISDASDIIHKKLDLEEAISVADECDDVLCVLPAINNINLINHKLTTAITFDIIFKNKNGSISSVRRSINAEDDGLPSGTRLCSYKLSKLDISPDPSVLNVQCSLEFTYQSVTNHEHSAVQSVELLESQPYSTDTFPSVSIVRPDNESIWELAKKYHSSVEKISEYNDIENLKEMFVMIPTEF